MVKLNRIYTRSGDDGTTGLVDGSRASKNSLRIEAIGKVDEANSALGLLAAALEEGAMAKAIYRIQNDLFDLGADLATPLAPDAALEGEGASAAELRVAASQVEWLEQAIDELNRDLEPLDSFVLPGGSEAAARCHLARAMARAAERACVALAEREAVNRQALAYLNRLSDYLFVLARSLNDGGRRDIKWVPGAGR